MRKFKLIGITIMALLYSALVSAEDIRFDVNGIHYYSLDSTGVCVRYVDDTYSGDLIIPETVTYNDKDYKVTALQEGMLQKTSLITSIRIPKSVTTIYGNIYMHFNTGLRQIIVDDDNPYYDSRDNCNAVIETATNTLLFGCNNTVIPNTVTSIGRSAFMDCSAIKEIYIHKNVNSIAPYAFYGCNNLAKVTISEGVKNIGNSSFYGCSSLNAITIPASVEKLEPNPFGRCNALTSIIVDEGNKIYDSRENCNAIIETATNTLIVACNGTNIPEGISGIGEEAFYACDGLKSITIPSTVNNIGSYAIRDCKLNSIVCKAVKVPETKYGAFSFVNNNIPIFVPQESVDAYKLDKQWGKFKNIFPIGDSIHIGSKIYIGNFCFQLSSSNTVNLISGGVYKGDVVVPDSIEFYGTTYRVVEINGAFSGCNELNSVTIPSSVHSVGDNTFYNCSLCSLIIKDSNVPLNIGKRSSGQIYPYERAPFYDCKLNYIYIGRDLNYNMSYNNNYSPFYSRIQYEKNLVMGDSVTSINDYMFQNIYLHSVNLSKNIQRIGKYAFADNPLRNAVIRIPSSCTTIGEDAFYGCSAGIDSIIVSENNLYYDSRQDCNALISKWDNTLMLGCKRTEIPNTVTAIHKGAFRCKYSSQELKNINIPESVVSIGAYAFENCAGLKELVIPSSVKTIGQNAFNGCKNIHKVTFMGDYINIFNDIASNIDTLLIPNSKIVGTFSNFTALKKLDIGGAEEIQKGALAGLENLTDLTISFIGCGNINTATQNNGVFAALFNNTYNENMRQIAQQYNDEKYLMAYVPAHLEKLTITEGCTSLNYGALHGMSMLKEISLPSSLYMLSEKALYGCAGLEHIYCRGAAPAACLENTFIGVRTITCILHIPYNSYELYKQCIGWKDFYQIQEEQPMKVYITHNIQNAGIVIGNTEYAPNSTASLTAIANSGYKFVAWIENGEVVCNAPKYEFPIDTNRTLLAVFEPVINENNVSVLPESDKVYFTWDIDEGAELYTLTIYADKEMTTVVSTHQFDANGNLTRTSDYSQVGYLIEGLSSSTEYYYSLKGQTKEGIIISQSTGSFTTTAQGGTSIEGVNKEIINVSYNAIMQLIVVKGLEPGDVVYLYDAKGICIDKQATCGTNLELDMNQLPDGIYIVRVKDCLQKVLVGRKK
ncbi:MAG: leucine-rich repeat domain-containing protein [Bacteroidaceae bacterium]|nr:leucine-rich repeat domain-containing protein [Bacteroidaceae bacterium]